MVSPQGNCNWDFPQSTTGEISRLQKNITINMFHKSIEQ
jgi:hypothetical protein